jgi:hypothetical protein
VIFVYAVVSPALPSGCPASDLDGVEWTFQDSARESADIRAQRRLEQIFALASAERFANTTLRFVGEHSTLTAYRRAQEAA